MAQTHEIRIEKHSYLPKNQPIAKGDTVVWINNDPDNHTVTADDGSFDSGQLESKQKFSHTFYAGGTISYHCDNHPDMKGTIAVEQKAQTHTIEITRIAYPDDTPVAKGDTVEWINRMDGHEHTVTADNGAFDSGPFGQDQKFSQVFDTAGTFPYHCQIHFRMKGKVTVT